MEDMDLHRVQVKMSNRYRDNPLNEKKFFLLLRFESLLDNNSNNHV
jgi:hypothetical protein